MGNALTGRKRSSGQPHRHMPELRLEAAPDPYPAQMGGIRNKVNVKKETLKLEPDEENPGKFLVVFSFDAIAAGRINIVFFAQEGLDCVLSATKETVLPPVTVPFKEGLEQKFRQPCGTGIDFLLFEEHELLEAGEMGIYPLAIKVEASGDQKSSSSEEGKDTFNSQITQAVFDRKANGQYQIRVVMQILWMYNVRYELHDIYGDWNSNATLQDENDTSKLCVVCRFETVNTVTLPCKHLCMCRECAKTVRLQTSQCPMCRTAVETLMEMEFPNN